MGGLFACVYALDHPETIDGLLLSGPAVSIEMVSSAELTAAKILSEIVPNLRLTKIEADGISRDPKVVADYLADPLVDNGRIETRLGGEIVKSAEALPDRLAELEMPLLLMHGGDDKLDLTARQQARLRGRFLRRQDARDLRRALPRDPQRARAGPRHLRHRHLARRARLSPV